MENEFNSQSEFIRWNEEMATKFDPDAYHLRSNLIVRWIEKIRVGIIIKFLNVHIDDSVLEVGCGAGNVLEEIPSRQRSGIDISTFLLNKSKIRFTGITIKLSQADAAHLPFISDIFAKVYCTEVLEHVINPRLVIQEMARIVQPGGTIVISIPNEKLINQVKGLIDNLHLARLLNGRGENGYHIPKTMTDEWHLHFFSLPLLKSLVNNLLTVEEIKAIPFRILPLRYVVKCRKVS